MKYRFVRKVVWEKNFVSHYKTFAIPGAIMRTKKQNFTGRHFSERQLFHCTVFSVILVFKHVRLFLLACINRAWLKKFFNVNKKIQENQIN